MIYVMRVWWLYEKKIKKHFKAQFSVNSVFNNEIEKNQLKNKKYINQLRLIHQSHDYEHKFWIIIYKNKAKKKHDDQFHNN